MKKTELKALIKEAFLTEKKNTLLNESAPGFDNRKQGEALPTLESIKAAYQAKKLEEAEIEDKKLTYSDFVDMVRADMRAGAANDENTSENQIERVARWKYDDYLKGTSIDDLFLYEVKEIDEADLNDPVAMKMRAAKMKADKLAKMRAANAGDDGNDKFFDAAKLRALKKKRAQVMRDMEQEAEMEGGPIADKYGDMLNKIDKAIAMLNEATKEAEIKEAAEDTKEETEATKELTAAVKDLGDAKEEAGLKEDRFVDAALEDLRQVIDNLAHTSGMNKEEAAEMAMMHIEDMFMGGEELEEATPTVFDDKSMDDLLNIILKYVEDPADAEKELERFDAGGFEAMSDSVQANLDRDKEYKAWYNELHSIKEEGKKDYWADYTDIGMFYLEGSGKEKSLTDNEYEELGEKIVKQLYAGDVGKAYDNIVRGRKRGSTTDVKEVKMDKEFKAVAAGARKSDELNKIANRLYPEIAKKQEGGKLVNFYPLTDDQISAVYAEYTKLNEVEIAEATELPKDIEWEFDDVIDQIDIHNATIALIGHSESTGKDYTASAEASKIGDDWDWIEVDEIEEEPINESVITEADMIVESFKK